MKLTLSQNKKIKELLTMFCRACIKINQTVSSSSREFRLNREIYEQVILTVWVSITDWSFSFICLNVRSSSKTITVYYFFKYC